MKKARETLKPFVPFTMVLVVLFMLTGVQPLSASTEKFRLVWNGGDDPSTTIVIAWNQISGNDPVVYYDTRNHGINYQSYANSQTPYKNLTYRGMNNYFVKLTDLQPDTAYYFVVKDSEGVKMMEPDYPVSTMFSDESFDFYNISITLKELTKPIWFITAPDSEKNFTFIAGGDSRTHPEGRMYGNVLVSKIRPLFIAHGGDYLDSGTDSEWNNWLNEWQLTRSSDGQMYPIFPAHGNHENDDTEMVTKIFGTSNPDAYAAFNVGGDLARFYTVNTELEPGVGYGAFTNQDDTKWNQQTQWLKTDLETYKNSVTWKIANYHRPLRPHRSTKSEGEKRYTDWAPLFYDNGVDLAIECDSHNVKYTYPVRPAQSGESSIEGFIRDDANGTVFVGEGSWGAPTRDNDDDKPWTLDSSSFWQFKYVQVTRTKMDVRTVKFGNKNSQVFVSYNPTIVTEKTAAEIALNPFDMPSGLDIWHPMPGKVLSIPFTGADINNNLYVQAGSSWKYLDTGTTPQSWETEAFDDSAWKTGNGQLGYGDSDEKTVIGYGGDENNKYITTYFRNTFQVADLTKVLRLTLRLLRDDGAVVYINGSEVARSNMPEGEITPATVASGAIGGDDEDWFYEIPLFKDVLKQGANTIAVELHQASQTSSDISFDLELIGTETNVTGTIPAIPTEIKAVLNEEEKIEVSWTYDSTFTGRFQLEQKLDSQTEWTLIGNNIPNDKKIHKFSNPTPGAKYTYRVLALSQYGLSPYATAAELEIPKSEEKYLNLIAKDFNDKQFGLWTVYSVASNNDWIIDETGNDIYAKANGYGADTASDDWLISPAINLDLFSKELLSFETAKNYDGGTFEVKISTNYSGTGDPSASTWTTLDAKLSQGSYEWTSSGQIDLSAYSGTAYIAFHYTTTGTGGGDGALWEVDNIKISVPLTLEILSMDFNDKSFGLWNPYSVASNSDWTIDEYGENIYAKANGYGADTASDDWLISPAINLDNLNQETLEFETAKNYDGGSFEVKISTDYSGTGDPSASTWTTLDAKFSQGNYEWTSSGAIDISSYTGTAYIAFHYTSTGTGGGDGAIWEVDNIKVKGSLISKINSLDFNDKTSGLWSTFSVASDADWAIEEKDNKIYIKANGYGANEASDDWLISPEIDLSGYHYAELNFDTAKNYDGGNFEVLYSTDYSGSGDPLSATWKALSPKLSAGNNEWTNSGDLDLSVIAGSKAHIAFRYTSTGTGGGDGALWQIDNISVNGVSSGGQIIIPLYINLSADKTIATTNDEITFTASVAGGKAPYTYSWDFGDSSAPGTEKVVKHKFTTPGTYTISLTVTDSESTQKIKTSENLLTIKQSTDEAIFPNRADVRIASFNAYLNRSSEGELMNDLALAEDTQAQSVAEIIQRVKPDIILINEFDYDPDGHSLDLFIKNYLKNGWNGADPIDYPYYFSAESNTGIGSSFDFDNNGEASGTGNDAYGFGEFPGQYGMIVLSRYPILTDQVRTFQKFLWKDMPNAMLPKDPESGQSWYSTEELDVFRLSSKSHWDLPVNVNGETIHILASHPTPPVFDGAEDRNGTRNHDEIRFWADYVNPEKDSYIYDDKGNTGGLGANKRFVILGDQNADPIDGDSTNNAIIQLLNNELINSGFKPGSKGGAEQSKTGNGNPSFYTAGWKMRVDYVLPSKFGLAIINGGVFWPADSDVLFRLVGPSGSVVSSDHRLVFLDLKIFADENGNNIPDNQEPDENSDLDKDGIPDKTQNHIKSIKIEKGEIGISTKSSTKVKAVESLMAFNKELATNTTNMPSSLPMDLIDFRLKVENPGDTVSIKIYLSEELPSGARWFKYDPATGWTDYSDHATISGNQVTLELKDGGFGDADGEENSIIADPSGPAYSDDETINNDDDDDSDLCFISSLNTGNFSKGIIFFISLIGVRTYSGIRRKYH